MVWKLGLPLVLRKGYLLVEVMVEITAFSGPFKTSQNFTIVSVAHLGHVALIVAWFGGECHPI